MTVGGTALIVVLVSVIWIYIPQLLSPKLQPVWEGFTHKDFKHVEKRFRTSLIVVLVSVFWIYIPQLLSPKLQPVWGGVTHKDFKHVEKIFRMAIEDGRLKGGAVTVYYKGELIVDLWGGYADDEAERPWTKDTITQFYSTTKLIASIVIAQMVDKGLLDYKKPVSHYWPEFGQNGKDKITVEMLLSHQGGLGIIDEPLSILDLIHNSKMVEELLAKQKPAYEPGSKFGYHSITFGLYVDILAKKADPKHRNMSQIFQEDIAIPFGETYLHPISGMIWNDGPFQNFQLEILEWTIIPDHDGGIDYFIGVPNQHHHRMARIYPLTPGQTIWRTLTSGDIDTLRILYQVTPISGSDLHKGIVTIRELQNHNFVNDPDKAAIGVSSFNGQGSARGVAKLCGILANGGSYKGRQLLSPQLIERLNTPVVEGIDQTFYGRARFGPGTVLKETKKSQTIFGQPGFGGQLGFVDPNNRIGFAYGNNHLGIYTLWNDPIFMELQYAVYDAIK